jgi:hypothetical protein
MKRDIIEECAVYGDIPTTAVSLLVMNDDEWIVELTTQVGCCTRGREALATFPTRDAAECYIARTLGPSFARVCLDGAQTHDGYWLA